MSSFDQAAPTYDASFTDTTIGRIQRDRVWRYLDRHTLPSKSLNILELNCGTGEDATYLAEQGHHIVATDISDEMLEAVRRKAKIRKLSAQMVITRLDMTAPALPASAPRDFEIPKSFDLIFSNFGGFNCLSGEELVALSDFIKGHLAKDGSLIIVAMPRYCLFDILYRLTHFDFKRLGNRLFGKSTLVDVDGSIIRTYYYSPRALRGTFGEMSHIKTEIIGLLPSYLESFAQRAPFVRSVERMIQRAFSFLGGPLYRLSDHYLIHLKANE